MVAESTNPHTTLQPSATSSNGMKEQNFEMREPSKHNAMSLSPTPIGAESNISIGTHAGSEPVHQRGGKGGLCCGICAGLACFECLECCC